MHRRATLLVALLALAMVAASGAALADSISGDASNERLVGTKGKDHIAAGGGNDDVFGGGQGDALQGGLGADDLSGQKGRDFVNAIDGQANDSIDCGPGFDVVGYDDLSQVGGPADDVDFASCELTYVPVIGGFPLPLSSAAGPPAGLRNMMTVEQAERAVEDGLLRKIRVSG